MTIKKEFILNPTGEEYTLVPVGEMAFHFNRIILLNEVEAYMWNGLCENKNKAELVRSVMNEYEVSRSVVEKDVELFLQRLIDAGIVDSLQENADDSGKA